MEFGVKDGGGNGASCVGIRVRTDTTKLPDMATTLATTLVIPV